MLLGIKGYCTDLSEHQLPNEMVIDRYHQYIGLHVARSAQHEVQVARDPWRQPHFFYVFIKVF